jgi:hypothetical protein
MQQPPGPRLDPKAEAILQERFPQFRELSERLLGAVMPYLPQDMEMAIVALLSEATMLCCMQTYYGPYKPEQLKELAPAILSHFLTMIFEDKRDHWG